MASLNAVLRALGQASGTIHCRDEDPTNCGPEIAGQLETRFGSKRFGLVGLQPAILKALVNHFTREFVRVVDLNPDNIGSSKYGVEVWDGQSDLPRSRGMVRSWPGHRVQHRQRHYRRDHQTFHR